MSARPSTCRRDLEFHSRARISPEVPKPTLHNGYQAANTLAGSRLNTSLKDTAASVSIMTEEFLKDIGAISLDEAINFGNNVEPDYMNANNEQWR